MELKLTDKQLEGIGKETSTWEDVARIPVIENRGMTATYSCHSFTVADLCQEIITLRRRVKELEAEVKELKDKLTENIQGYSKLVRLVGKLKQKEERLSEALAGITCRHPQPAPHRTSPDVKFTRNDTPYKDCRKCPPCLARIERAKREEK